MRPISDFLSTITMTVRCPKCGAQSEQLVVASMRLLVQVHGMECEKCGQADWQKRKPVYVPKQEQQDDSAKRWREICPEEFLTVPEGGGLSPDKFKVQWDDEKKSLVWLWGGTGGGKTSSGWRLARKHFDCGNRINWFRQLRFGTAYAESGSSFKTDSWIADLCRRDSFLFIDDIGKAQWSAGAYGAFWEILDARCGEGSQTLITCQHSPDEMRKIWSNTPNAQEIATPFMRRANKGKIIQVK